MPQASGARTQLRYKLEGTNGSNFSTVNVSGSPADLRRTDDSLGFKTQTQTSQEIRSDRMTTDLVLVGASAEGGINFELSYNEYDTLLESVLQGAWTVYGTAGVGTTFAAAYTATTITAAVAPSTTSAFTTLAKGQWIRISHPGNANDKKLVQISKTVSPGSAAGTVITVEASTPLTVVTSTAGAIIQSSMLLNATTLRSFSFERDHSDITDRYVMFRGMTSSKLSLNFQSGAIVTGSMEFMGKDQLSPTTSTGFSGGASTASKINDVVNAVAGVGNIYEGGSIIGTVASGVYIKSLTLDVDNGLRGRDAIGVLGNAEIAAGTLSVTGKMSVYFANKTLFDKFITSTASSLAFSAQDSLGNGYMISLPKVKFSEGNIVSGNKDSDSMIEMGYTALMDTTTGTNQMIQIARVGAAVT